MRVDGRHRLEHRSCKQVPLHQTDTGIVEEVALACGDFKDDVVGWQTMYAGGFSVRKRDPAKVMLTISHEPPTLR